MQDEVLLKITVITDDSTGIYQVGELDFGKTGHCEDFLEKLGNRGKFVEHLRWLADAAENGTAPFLSHDKSPKGTSIWDTLTIGGEGLDTKRLEG